MEDFATGIETRRNIEYGQATGERLYLDAYIPPGPGTFPGAILVHGGGWVAGDRLWSVEPLFGPLLNAGFACLSISYRLMRDIRLFGAAVEDVEAAIRFVHSRAPEFRIDPSKLALVGESAGAQLAAMALLNPSASAVNAAVLLYAPVDLPSLAQHGQLIPPAVRGALQNGFWAGLASTRLRELSPIHHVRAGVPPLLLIHGTADPVVPFEQSREMCKKVRSVGSRCDLLAVKGGAHGVRRWEQSGLISYKALMTKWLQEQMELAPAKSRGGS